ncbi:MAG TPA: glycoside hydrolase family 5 protein [Clostridiales bacterium]|nr:glycoside hydrolase family 5 protein [Clostridiales bacterium]
MKKVSLRIISVMLSLLMFISLLPVGLAEGDVPADDVPADNTGFTDEDFLTVKGTKIYNRKGEEIILQGVNLGGWLIQEDWLCPYEEVSDHYTLLETLIERFGLETAYGLLNTYEDNFITEYDLDQIAEMGFNAVRVPFWYRNFYSDDVGTKILDENGEWDFSKLDWVVSECSERRLYVVLDMHGAPGFASDAPHNGKADSCGLYDKTEEGEFYRNLTDELWTAIATRFKGNPAVAMYDLLNEPMCDCPVTEIHRRVNNEMIYTRLYDTVRAADPDHIITLECIWTAFALPHTFCKGWTNVVYQVHFYQNSDFIFKLFVYLTRFYHFNVPLMMGEFFPHKATTWEGCFSSMNKIGYSWFLWTYKAAGHGMWESDWCLKGSKDGFYRAKIVTDTAEDIAYKWGEIIRTENGYQDSGHYETVSPWITVNK